MRSCGTRVREAWCSSHVWAPKLSTSRKAMRSKLRPFQISPVLCAHLEASPAASSQSTIWLIPKQMRSLLVFACNLKPAPPLRISWTSRSLRHLLRSHLLSPRLSPKVMQTMAEDSPSLVTALKLSSLLLITPSTPLCKLFWLKTSMAMCGSFDIFTGTGIVFYDFHQVARGLV